MEIALILLAVPVVGLLGAWLFKSGGERRHQVRVQELESRIRFAHGEAAGLKEQLASLRAEADVLKNGLEEERRSKIEALNQLALSFRKTLLAAGAVSMMMGTFVGGGLAWWTSGIQAEARYLQRFSQREIETRFALLKAELLEKQAGDREQAMAELRHAHDEVRVERAVALTKLGILLESLSPSRDKDKKFELDEQRFRKNLRRRIQDNPEPEFYVPGKSPGVS